jgi:imidazolonepropionase
MNLSSTHGSIAIGKKANIFITREIPSYSFLPYAFAGNLVETVIVNGKVQSTKN